MKPKALELRDDSTFQCVTLLTSRAREGFTNICDAFDVARDVKNVKLALVLLGRVPISSLSTRPPKWLQALR
jgi:hypothetical protein